MKPIAWIAIVVVAACGNVDPSEPDGAPGQPDAAPGTPDAPPGTPDAMEVSCTANAFIACEDDDTARLCNATGDGFIADECGAPGCNGPAQRCNECTPSAEACDGGVVERCDPDGLALPDETCATTCIDAPSAHCEYLSPHYLPDVCDAPPTEASFAITVGTTFDTSLDAACTGGVINNICVVRATTISIDATMTVVGSRPLALVADDSLTIGGTLDISASGTSNGPGGNRVSGIKAGSTAGGGGAGFKQTGANGGSTTDGGGSSGGSTFDPLAVTTLVGGAHQQPPPITGGASGGGGGGAATLIACRGSVAVSGTIDAAGGGGHGGIPDPVIGGATMGLGASGGGGGGSGGYVVIQGMSASITGRLYANGGGGGGGASGQTGGFIGGDGTRSVFVAATGGNAAGSAGGKGGAGGTGASSPAVGRANLSGGTAGGGGGSAGHFQIYVPTGVTPTLAPIESSPLFETTLTTPTR